MKIFYYMKEGFYYIRTKRVYKSFSSIRRPP
jgi:hypothetical protein